MPTQGQELQKLVRHNCLGFSPLLFTSWDIAEKIMLCERDQKTILLKSKRINWHVQPLK